MFPKKHLRKDEKTGMLKIKYVHMLQLQRQMKEQQRKHRVPAFLFYTREHIWLARNVQYLITLSYYCLFHDSRSMMYMVYYAVNQSVSSVYVNNFII